MAETESGAIRTEEPALKVLFVCSANVCRSPLAAGLLLREAHSRSASIGVASAGFLLDGQVADPHVVDILRDAGVDITHKRSRTVNADVVGSADLILGMTTSHVRQLLADYPQVQHKVFAIRFFGQDARLRPKNKAVADWIRETAESNSDASRYLLDGTPADVLDPVGQPRAVFDDLSRELSQIITWLVRCANLDGLKSAGTKQKVKK